MSAELARIVHPLSVIKSNPLRPGVRQPALSVVIVNYNCKTFTIDCLRSVFAQSYDFALEVIVVDNASHDGSVEDIPTAFPQVRFVSLAENVGFGRGCNCGATLATAPYILLLNPDSVVRPDTIRNLMRFAKDHPDAGIWGGRTYNGKGVLDPSSCWRFPTPWSTFCIVAGLARAFPKSPRFNAEGYGGWQRDSVREVDVVTGCLLLVERSLWDKLGGFDPVYFMYSEEVDLCRRARDLGARPLISPDVEVVHYSGVTEKVRADRLIKQFKGKRTYMLRHWPWLHERAGAFLLLTWSFGRFAFLSTAGALLKRPAIHEGAHTWGNVWRRRHEWLPGYRTQRTAPEPNAVTQQ